MDMDAIRKKAEELAEEHGESVENMLDKAKEMITARTPDSIDDKVEGAVDKAKDLLGKLGGGDDAEGGE